MTRKWTAKIRGGFILKMYNIVFSIKLLVRWAFDIAEEAFASFHAFFVFPFFLLPPQPLLNPSRLPLSKSPQNI